MKNKILPVTILLIAIFWTTTVKSEAMVDADQDGLSDNQEIGIYFTNPQLADSDADGYLDGEELNHGYSPRYANKKLTEVDSDKDYLPDAWEIALGTGLMNPDSDGDKYLDGTEVRASFDPLDPQPEQKEKLIMVDLTKQLLTYSFNGKTLETFPISSGITRLPTPKGDFNVIKKYPLKTYSGAGYYYPNTKWNLHFTTKSYNYYIHGTYWHNDFGRPKSHGCINVSYSNMKRLYDWAQVGTQIKIQ